MDTFNTSIPRQIKRILLIENNPDDAEMLEFQLQPLKQDGLELEHCDCLAAGLIRLAKDDIDLVFLDLSLPDSSGIASVSQVHRAALETPLIVLTGTDDKAVALEAIRSGAQDCLIKSEMDLPTLCRAISYATYRQESAGITARLAGIVEASDDSIIGKTVRGTITSWNGGAERLYGYSQGEAIGKSVEMLIPDPLPGDLQRLLAPLIRGETIRNPDVFRIKKDGEAVEVSETIAPIKQVDGTVTGAASIARDITDRKLSESALVDLKQRLTLALEAGDVGVWDVNLEDGSIWHSLRHDEIFGHKSARLDWNFDTFFSYVHPGDRPHVTEIVKQGIKTGSFNLECRIIRADGVMRWIAAHGKTVKSVGNRRAHMMGTITDITERMQQEEQRHLMSVMEQREDVMATLAHDLKNPLIGANRVLEHLIGGRVGPVSDEQVSMLTCVVQSNCGALKLIRDLIDVYKWEKEANALSLESIDYSRLIKECVDRASLVSKQRGIHITIELLEITGVVRADYYAIERVLTNLLDNAIKFSPGGGNVVVRFFQSGNMENILEVEDHGAGIKPEDQCRLFKRFSQGVDGKRYSGGSGLGLYLCKQIVECHGGTIECVSQLNTSTIFRVRLPAANMMTQYDVKTLRGIHSRT